MVSIHKYRRKGDRLVDIVVAEMFQKLEELILIPESATGFLWNLAQAIESRSTRSSLGVLWAAAHRARPKAVPAYSVLFWNGLSPPQRGICFIGMSSSVRGWDFQ